MAGAYLSFGGDGGGSNSPSKRGCPGLTTSLVSSLISPYPPQLTGLDGASQYIFRYCYWRDSIGTLAFRHLNPNP
jgi:hypothetical protein